MVLAVGVWAWNEKDMFSNLTKLTFIALDPAFVLICTGGITFAIGFTGSVGALRENTCLLGTVGITSFIQDLIFSNIFICVIFSMLSFYQCCCCSKFVLVFWHLY